MNYTHEEQGRLAWLAGDYERAALHDEAGYSEFIDDLFDGEEPESIKERLETAERQVDELTDELRGVRDDLETVMADLQELRDAA